ncbi:MAG: hypothetical protein GF331_16565 [Chitinivibrionales bacterium]|nr:hypothetical protein [Chitinivibrionales bacterium]
MKAHTLAKAAGAVSLVALQFVCSNEPVVTEARTSYPSGWPKERYFVIEGTEKRHGTYTKWFEGLLKLDRYQGEHTRPLPLSASGLWVPFVDHDELKGGLQGWKEIEGHYHRGKKQGMWLTRHGRHEPRTLESWWRGKRHGMYKHWSKGHGNERVLLELGAYVDGQKEGYWRDSTGERCLIHGQSAPEPDSVAEGTRPEGQPAGKPAFQTEYRDGRRNGIHREWDSKGRLTVVGAYRDGVKVGYWRGPDYEGCYEKGRKSGFWHENGPPRLGGPPFAGTWGVYVNGERYDWWSYRRPGWQTKQLLFERGTLVDSSEVVLEYPTARQRRCFGPSGIISRVTRHEEHHNLLAFPYVLSRTPQWTAPTDSTGRLPLDLPPNRCEPFSGSRETTRGETRSNARWCLHASGADSAHECTRRLEFQRSDDSIVVWCISLMQDSTGHVLQGWTASSQPMYRVEFLNSRCHGHALYYYCATDLPPSRPWEQWTYRQGMLHGPYVRWSPDGDTIETAMYENDSCVARECRR